MDGAGWSRPRGSLDRRAQIETGCLPGPRLAGLGASTFWLFTAVFASNPSPKKTADLGHHAAYMFVLSIAQPLPVVGQTQVESEAVQGGIAASKCVESGATALCLGLEKAILSVQHRVH